MEHGWRDGMGQGGGGVEPTAIVSPVPLIQYYSQERSDHTLCGISGGQYSVCPSTDAPYVYERIEVGTLIDVGPHL